MLHSGVAEVGYLIDEAYHNQGIASAALRQIVNLAFENGLNKIKEKTIAQNITSYRVLEKVGFEKEGILKREFLVQNKLHDVYLWALLRRESYGQIYQ